MSLFGAGIPAVFKFKLLPWNMISQGLTVLIGVIILTGFLVGLPGLTPVSVKGAITGRIVDIAPQVSGRVITVEAEPNFKVDEGAVLFSIDPVSFESGVDELEARLQLAQLGDHGLTGAFFGEIELRYEIAAI